MNESTRKPDDLETSDYPLSGDPASHFTKGAGEVGSRSDSESLFASEDVEQLRREREEFREQALRSRAEFANYQKRAKQQADADRAYAVGSLARDLLDSLDNLARAIDALRASGAADVTAGLDMVQKQLHEVLAKHGVEPIAALGGSFDPNLHDAVLQQPSREHPEGTVVGELTKGYKIRDRVLRPSKVAVSVRPPAD